MKSQRYILVDVIVYGFIVVLHVDEKSFFVVHMEVIFDLIVQLLIRESCRKIFLCRLLIFCSIDLFLHSFLGCWGCVLKRLRKSYSFVQTSLLVWISTGNSIDDLL
jgi:hypothetical protein